MIGTSSSRVVGDPIVVTTAVQIERSGEDPPKLRLLQRSERFNALLQHAASNELLHFDFLEQAPGEEMPAETDKNVGVRTAMRRFPFAKPLETSRLRLRAFDGSRAGGGKRHQPGRRTRRNDANQQLGLWGKGEVFGDSGDRCGYFRSPASPCRNAQHRRKLVSSEREDRGGTDSLNVSPSIRCINPTGKSCVTAGYAWRSQPVKPSTRP